VSEISTPRVTTMVERAGLGLYTLPEEVDPARTDLAEEFLAQPLGRHREELQLVVSRLRSDLGLPRLVIQRSADDRVVLLSAPRRRGAPPRPIATVANVEDAERLGFRLRWVQATGQTPPGADPPHEAPVSLPDAPARLLAYTSTTAVRPGEQVTLHVSAPGPVEVELVRVRSRRREDAVAVEEVAAVVCPASPQRVVPGAHGRVLLGDVAADGPVTLQLTFCPTHSRDRRQVLASWGDPWRGEGLALHLEPGGRLAATACKGGVCSTVELPEATFTPWTWHTVTATVGATSLSIRALGEEKDRVHHSTFDERAWRLVPGELVIGATGVGGPCNARDHFDGRVEQLALVAGPLSAEESRHLAMPGGTCLVQDLVDRLIGWWDFSVDIAAWTITDRGPRARHGTWHNLPRRAVCGSRWDGTTEDWRRAPDQFAAVHLCSDALEDAGWPVTHALTVPNVASGFYAFRVRHHDDEIDVPLIVMPPSRASTPVLLLVPTATYTAYANSRFWWEDPIQEAVSDRLVEIGEGDRTLMAWSELGLSHYDQHADGTDVCHVSDRRPNVYLRADNVHDEGYCSDLDLVEWLEDSGYHWAAVTDRELDRDPSLLDRCNVLVTGTHPEYVSGNEFDALARWIHRGGRMLYLGGNGFQTRVNFDKERPWITENRRIEHWGGSWPTMTAERRLASDGDLGGYVAQMGRSTIGLLGVESVTMGFDESRPYHRLADPDPRTAFVFDGIAASVIGAHGRIGGAVVGQEWDNAAGTDVPPDHYVLAHSEGHSIIPALFGAARAPYHCDMTIRFEPSGGAVFAVGTMAWCAALNDVEADVSRITRNVIDRFLDPAGWPSDA
jgi:N,N-dimethylformamidase